MCWGGTNIDFKWDWDKKLVVLWLFRMLSTVQVYFNCLFMTTINWSNNEG